MPRSWAPGFWSRPILAYLPDWTTNRNHALRLRRWRHAEDTLDHPAVIVTQRRQRVRDEHARVLHRHEQRRVALERLADLGKCMVARISHP